MCTESCFVFLCVVSVCPSVDHPHPHSAAKVDPRNKKINNALNKVHEEIKKANRKDCWRGGRPE